VQLNKISKREKGLGKIVGARKLTIKHSIKPEVDKKEL